MRYKTRVESNKVIFIFLVIAWLLYPLVYLSDSDRVSMPGVVLSGLFSILLLAYCSFYNIRRHLYKKLGECFHGHIVGADRQFNGRGEDTFYLIISFHDNGRKMKYTKGYVGNPNHKLKTCDCSIYKWNGKYLEDGFYVREKKEKPTDLHIPIDKYQASHKRKARYV